MAEMMVVMEAGDEFLTMENGRPRRWSVDNRGTVAEIITTPNLSGER